MRFWSMCKDLHHLFHAGGEQPELLGQALRYLQRNLMAEYVMRRYTSGSYCT